MRVGSIIGLIATAIGASGISREYGGAHNYRVGYGEASWRAPRKVTFIETPKPLSKRARRRARGKGKAR